MIPHLIEFLLKVHTEHAVRFVEDQVFQRAQIEPLGIVTQQQIERGKQQHAHILLVKQVLLGNRV